MQNSSKRIVLGYVIVLLQSLGSLETFLKVSYWSCIFLEIKHFHKKPRNLFLQELIP